MKLMFVLSAALTVAVLPAAATAQATSDSEAGAAIQQAATAFAQCVTRGMQGLDAAVAPEAGASSVLGGCAAERGRLEQSVYAMIETLPEEQKAQARERVRVHMAEAESEIAEAIRDRREAPTPAAASAD